MRFKHPISAVAVALAVAAASVLVVRSPLSAPDAAQAARDPWLRPFSSTSIWNMPIGSGAHYVDAGLPAPGFAWFDKAILRRLSAADPARPLLRPASWQQRCGGDAYTGVSLNIPDSWLVPEPYQLQTGQWITPNNTAAFLLPDGRTVFNANTIARCQPGGPVYGWNTADPARDLTDLYGDGRIGSHGASKLSVLGGAIRPGELDGPAPIQHALDLLVWAQHLHWGGSGYRWPASSADGYAAQRYTGSNSELRMGSLLAIPPSVSAAQLGISTHVGHKLFAAMQDYGGYVTEDAGHDAAYVAVDEAAVGTFSWGPGEQADFKRIIDAAHVVANNSPTSIGGGGTPRRPLLPELGAPASARTAVVPPSRLVDTRPLGTTIDGRHARAGELDAGKTMAVQITGRGGVPSGAAVALLNVTTTESHADGFATVYPCGGAVPNTSTVNFRAGTSVANAALVALDGAGKVCVFTSATTDIVVDASGWFAGDDVKGLRPSRLLDSRSSGRRDAGSVTRVRVAGVAGVPAARDVGVVGLNVTVTEPWGAGFVTAFPCGGPVPNTSTVNFEGGETRANAALLTPGDGGDVCLYTDASTHLIVDVVAWSPNGSLIKEVAPARVGDTRAVAGTVDGVGAGTGSLPPGGVVAVQVLGRAGVPSGGVQAVALNVTTTASRRDGFLTVFPCGGAVPNASNVNHAASRSVAGTAVVRVGDGGRICVFSDAPGDVVVDVTGYVTG